MLPPIWPSDGIDSPVFWLAVLMWCVFFVVMGLLGKRKHSAHCHCRGHGKKTPVPEKENLSEPSQD